MSLALNSLSPRRSVALAVAFALASCVIAASALAYPPPQPVSPAFTYQGVLKSGGAPINGLADIQFSLWDQAVGGFQYGSTMQVSAAVVSNGLFSVEVNFGTADFNGLERWLQIAVRTPAGSPDAFTTLTPRQRFAPTPYSLYALAIGGVQSGAVTFSNASNDFMGATLDIDSGTLHVDAASNRVGIGIDTPVATLHVRNGLAGLGPIGGSSLALESSANHYLSMLAPDANESGLLFGRPGADVPVAAAGIIFNSANTPDGLQFRSGGGNVTRMVIDNTGLVGIGTEFPTHALTVRSGFTSDALRLVGPTGVEGYAAKLNFGDGNGAYLWEDSNDNLAIAANRIALVSPVLFGMPAVGIGTYSPQRMLQVGESSFFGSEAMMRMVSASGFSNRTWDIGVPTGGAAPYAFVIDDTQFGADPEFVIRYENGWVGIGTTNPIDKLTVVGAGTAISAVDGVVQTRLFSAASTGRGYVGTNTNHPFVLRTNGGDRMLIDVAGNVGIGTDAPAQTLSVNGTAGKPGGGSWATFSDARLKTNVRDLDSALDSLLALRGVRFEYKDPDTINERSGTHIGMIAQEVEKTFPQWVSLTPNGYKQLSFSGFEALTVEALRDLRSEKDAQIAQLRQDKDAEIASLHEQLQLMQLRLEAIERRLPPTNR